MATLVVLTAERPADVLPSLTLLDHRVRAEPLAAGSLVDPVDADVVVVDGRLDLPTARSVCRLAQDTGLGVPVLLVLTEGGLAAVTPAWGCSDIVLTTAGPAELAARIRLLADRPAEREPDSDVVEAGELVIDAAAYTARVRGQVLNLTYKEFELLRHLAQHPGRVFTRAQLLDEVWGYDYYGGTRTVDVHIRRLRAKLGAEHDQLIGTVRNVGYRFVPRPATD
ncbi:response regulator transcription factor [uncultured Georgenia sp.]|uniref:winged helix-turn-helix domain-containing protein n=1 Tax=uncultured Georgenia sp. TaxID=378209 RepID=UPI00263469EB|nr:response regulator transcription factor [uncultured Georgenia sp.]HLV05040.1 response regulator transcription factor [Actinomycetaceae bacterium]